MAKGDVSALVIATASGAPLVSERPKPIHVLCGRPMLSWVLNAVSDSGVSEAVVVTGPDGDWIAKRIMDTPPSDLTTRFLEQPRSRGNAEAALIGMSGFDEFDDEGDVLILPADMPLLTGDVLQEVLTVHRQTGSACTIACTRQPRRSGTPYVLRDRHGNAIGVTVSNDDGEAGNPVDSPVGVMVVRRGLLAPAIRRTMPDPATGRHLLRDVPGVLADSGHAVATVAVLAELFEEVDNRIQLAAAEAVLRNRINHFWMARGVTMIDPSRTIVDATVTLSTDVTLFPGVSLSGSTAIGEGCDIGPDTHLDHCTVGPRSVVRSSTGQLAAIGEQCIVGPFAALSPGAQVSDRTVTGPFYASGA
ncbi:MAG: NTP transferase domain-containing protein [Acidimicrobiales bacterium]|nr:NTP transferase domain-containing protein [Acidimicrobiales bacterium]